MKRKMMTLLMAALPSFVLWAQTNPYKQQVDAIFGSLNQSKIPSGILMDYGLELADYSQYKGTLSPVKPVDIHLWNELYATVLSSVINPSTTIPHIRTVNSKVENYYAGYGEDAPVDLLGMYIRYQVLKTDAVSKGLIQINNQKLYDISTGSNTPYNTDYVFAIAPTAQGDPDGKVRFVYRPDLFENHSGKTLSSFRADFDNGAGYINLTAHQPYQVNYSTAGTKNLKFKLNFTDGTVRFGYAKFEVASAFVLPTGTMAYDSASARHFIFPRSADTNCPEAGFPNPQTWSVNGSTRFGRARVAVAYGEPRNVQPTCAPVFHRPLIVVEGYDAHKIMQDPQYPNWRYEDLISSRGNGGLNIFVNQQGATFNDLLDNAGYDIIFVDLEDATDDIVRNAYLLENIIRWVNAHKVVNPATGVLEPNVVMGTSMGGLIARYAVCDMEKRWQANASANPHHQVRLLITQDSPHRGANTPVGLQAANRNLASMNLGTIGLASYGVVGGVVGSFIEMRDIVKPLRNSERLLNEPGSQQMLVAKAGTFGSSATVNFLTQGYRQMVSFASGYTPSFRMIATSNGSECGFPSQAIEPYGDILKLNANFYVNRVAYAYTGLALSTVSGPVAPLVSGVLLALTPLTGKNWKTQLEIKSLPTSTTGARRVFYGKVEYKKYIFGLIGINLTLWERSHNSTSGMLEWDSAPGGSYDISDVKGQIEDNNTELKAFPIIDVNFSAHVAEGFTFVSTVSALDIATLNSTSLYARYTGGTSPHLSRFANFATQEVINGLYNTPHVLFTSQSANWVLSELENAPFSFNCTFLCEGSDEDLISGNSTVCTSNSTYSLPPVEVGTTITWSNGPNLTLVGGQGTRNYTVRASNSSATGASWVQATLRGPCGTIVLPRKDVWVGAPAPAHQSIIYVNGYYGQNPVNLAKGALYDFYYQPIDGATSYTWQVPSGFSLHSGQGSSLAKIWTGNTSGTFTIRSTPSNSCGTYGSQTLYVVLGSNDGGCATPPCPVPIPAFTYSPNPADQTLEINWEGDVETLSNQETELVLYDYQMNERLRSRGKGKKQVLRVAALPEGYYILHINLNGEQFTERIQIQRK